MIKWFVIFYLLMVSSFSGADQVEKVEAWDSYGNVEYRKPPIDKVEEFKKNPSYNYDKLAGEKNILQRIIIKLIEWFLRNIANNTVVKYFFVGVIVLFILFLILRLLNIRGVGFFAFSKKNKSLILDMEHHAEVGTKDELLNMFKLYRDNNAYREAVRMLYLIYLKGLSDEGFIRLAKNKTGRDYANELKNGETRKIFKKLSRLYEYVWFGQFDIVEAKYSKIEQDFIKYGMMELV